MSSLPDRACTAKLPAAASVATDPVATDSGDTDPSTADRGADDPRAAEPRATGTHAAGLTELLRVADREVLAAALAPVVRGMVGRTLGPADPHLIDTAANDAILAILGARDTFRGDARVTTWIGVITRRIAVRAARREAAARARFVCLDDAETLEVAGGAAPAPEDPAVVIDAWLELEDAVPNPDWRRAWLLVNDPGRALTREEAARLTGYTPGSLAVILSRVRQQIARRLR